MKVPTRILSLAKAAGENDGRYRLDCIHFQRINGHATATVTNGYALIVATWDDGLAVNEDWSKSVSTDLVNRTRIAAEELSVECVSVDTHSEGGVRTTVRNEGRREATPDDVGKFIKTFELSAWDGLDGTDEQSFTFNPLLLLRTLETIVEVIGATDEDEVVKDVVLTMPRVQDVPLLITADVDGVKLAAAVMCRKEDCGHAEPAWNPAELNKPRETRVNVVFPIMGL